MQLKIGDKVVVGLIWNGGYIFKEQGEIKAIVTNKADTKPIQYLVNGNWYKFNDLYHEDEWNKATKILENRV